MTRPLFPLLRSGLFACSAVTLAHAQETTTHAFPALQAQDLNGKAFTVPGDFTGRPAVALVAFAREQQTELDRVIALLTRVRPQFPQLQLIELPVIDRPVALMRWFINTGMRSGIVGPAARAGVVTLYVDLPAWQRATGLVDKTKTYLVLTDPTGRLLRAVPTAELKTDTDLTALLMPFAPAMP